MNLEKMAAADAAEWARAEMFFGEGAGTRRKLLNAALDHKVSHIPGYNDLFEKAYSKLNMGDIAMKAIKERQSIDRAAVLSKNAKALLRGDRRGLSTGVLVVVTVGYVCYQMGWDKVIIREGKHYYKKAKSEVKARKFRSDLKKQFQFPAGGK